MKIPNRNLQLNSKLQFRRELQQITFNHSSDTDFQAFINLLQKCTAKRFCFLVIDTTLA